MAAVLIAIGLYLLVVTVGVTAVLGRRAMNRRRNEPTWNGTNGSSFF